MRRYARAVGLLIASLLLVSATAAPSPELPWWAAPFKDKPFAPPYIEAPVKEVCHVKRHVICTDAMGNESIIV